MPKKMRRIDLVRSPNIRFLFSGPQWEFLREEGRDQVRALRVSNSGWVEFSLEGSEMYITGQFKTPQGRDNAIPSINCIVRQQQIEQLMLMQLGIGEGKDYSCAWNGTDTTASEGPRNFVINVPFPVGVGEDPESEATIDSIHYLPSSTTSEFVTQGASVVYDNSDPHIDFAGAWETLKDQDGEAVSIASRQGSAMSVIFTGNSVIWYGWLPAGDVPGQSSAFYSIDGGTPVVVNWEKPRLEATRRGFELFRISDLPSGTHNLTVVHQGSDSGLPLVLDYLLIGGGNHIVEAERPALPPPGPSSAPLPSDSSSKSSTNSRSSNTGAIVGGVVGALALVLLIILGLLWARKRRANRNNLNPNTPPTASLGYPTSFATSNTTFTSPTGYSRDRDPISPIYTEESSMATGTPVRTASSSVPPSTSSDHLITRSTTYRKAEEARSRGNEDASDASTSPRQHQDSGVRLTPNRRSSLPPVYTAN